MLSHIFLVSPQIFTLSSWSVVAMTAEEGFLTSRLKHKIDNQASWVLLNSTTYICIAYQLFFFFLFVFPLGSSTVMVLQTALILYMVLFVK